MTERINRLKRKVKEGKFTFEIHCKFEGEKLSIYTPKTAFKFFDDQIDEVFDMNPEKIVVKLYSGNQKKAIDSNVHVFELRQKQTALNGIQLNGLEAFGGMQQVLGSIVASETLKDKAADLRASLEREVSQKQLFEQRYDSSKEQITDLKEKIRNLEHDLKIEKSFREEDVKRAKGNAFSTQKLLEIAGTVVGNIAGLDKEKMLGYLGLNESDDIEPQKSVAPPTKVEYDVVEDSPTQMYRKAIDDWMLVIIDKNPTPEPIMRKLFDVVMFIAKTPENLETIHSLVK